MSQSAFKHLYNEMFKAGGDASKLPKNLTKQLLKVFVKESHPHFLVSDSYFYVPCYFTEAAVKEFRDKHPSINITDLENNVILITNWSLEMRRVDSSAVFTSYAGLEVRLIVHSFKPNLNEKIVPTRHPVNIYRDDEMKTVIQHFRHARSQAALAARKSVDMPDVNKVQAGKGKVESQGVVAGGKGDDLNFKDGTTATLSISDIAERERKSSAKKSASVGGVRVKGGVSAKRAAKSGSKVKKASAKKSDVGKTVEKVLKVSDKKVAPKGKQSAKRSVSKKTPALPSPGGKKSTHTTDRMTMAGFKQFLKYHDSTKKKTLGKRSAGKSSASGKASKPKRK